MSRDVKRLQLSTPQGIRNLAKALGTIGAGDEIPNADKLDSVEDLSCYFSEPLVKKMVHLVVRLPRGECLPCVASHESLS